MTQQIREGSPRKPKPQRSASRTGENVRVISGPFANFSGYIDEDACTSSRRQLRVMVGSGFGRAAARRRSTRSRHRTWRPRTYRPGGDSLPHRPGGRGHEGAVHGTFSGGTVPGATPTKRRESESARAVSTCFGRPTSVRARLEPI